MNIPWPIKQEFEQIWTEVTGMIHSWSETINKLIENLWNALPYALMVLMVGLLVKYGIEEGMKHITKVYRDEDV